MSHRLVTLLIAGSCVLAALVVAAVVSVPYVALMPGPTLNTLGKPDGTELIQISGHPTYPTTGNLNLVTVSYTGGPGTGFNVFSALRAWLSPDDAVVRPTRSTRPGKPSSRLCSRTRRRCSAHSRTPPPRHCVT